MLDYLRITRTGTKKKTVWTWALHKRSGDVICSSKGFKRWDGVTGSLNRTFETSKKQVQVTVDGKHRGNLPCKDLSTLAKEVEDEG